MKMTEKEPNGYYVPADRGGATMIYAPQAEVKQRYEGEIVDRLIHHSHIVIFSGESYRLTQSLNRQRAYT